MSTAPAAFDPVDVDLDALRFSDAQRAGIAAAVTEKVAAGLAEDGQQVRALPAWLAPPEGCSGKALVVDAGGTNVRAALVEVSGKHAEVTAGPKGARLEVRDQQKTGADFFNQQAALAAALEVPPGAPLGYCFSYPSASLPDGDAELIAWTKGIDLPEVVGQRVGAELKRALAAHDVGCGELVVLNDTVAALLAGAGRAEDPCRTIGLIVGTGTNMAAFFAPGEGRKLEGERPMAVNLESGNITPPFLCALDDAIDKASNNPGQQRFEKAVSGHFLPQLFRCACPELNIDPAAGAEVLAQHAAKGERPGEVARALLDRSADYVGCGLAGVSKLLNGEGPVTVLAEGGLFWNAHGYPERVKATSEQLTGLELRIDHVHNANLLGSAVAALS